METQHALQVAVETDPDVDPDSPVLASILFRSARELLFNVVKHSGTHAARITARLEGDQILLRVADSGKGFDDDDVRRNWRRNIGFGLFSIEDRINMLGGRMEIGGGPRAGMHRDPDRSETCCGRARRCHARAHSRVPERAGEHRP